MKVVTVVGARPQFIKAATVSRTLRSRLQEVLVHTGQHYDAYMSDIFFEELGIPEPDYNLGVGSGSHGAQTAEMLRGIEEILLTEKPGMLIVYGDTNSTLAGALAAAKLHIPVAHVEAGLRSFNRTMPEEFNRILTDAVSSLLFAPSETGAANLAREGITQGVHVVGDVMYDAVLMFTNSAMQRCTILQDLQVQSKIYLLATVHRASNTDDGDNLAGILRAFGRMQIPVVLPLHPRTRSVIARDATLQSLLAATNIKVIDPVSYFDMLALTANAVGVLTDSGGLQKEAYFAQKPCVVLREDTEWIELVDAGWNRLVGADTEKICTCMEELLSGNVTHYPYLELYGDGKASEKITRLIEVYLEKR